MNQINYLLLGEDRRILGSDSKSKAQKSEDGEEVGNLRRRMEELVKEFEGQKDRNRQLKTKLNDVEKNQLSSSLKKEISKDELLRKRENDELKEDLEQLTQTVHKCLSMIETSDAAEGGFEVVKDRESGSAGDKQLLQKIEALTAMVENVSKTAFGVFSRQLTEKQQRFDEIKAKYEGLLMKAEEDLQKGTSALETSYGTKLKELSHKYNDAQKRVVVLTESNKKYERELSEMKKDFNEKNKYYQGEIESAKKDIKIKLDLMKSKDEIIRSLSDIKNNQAKEVSEFNDKMRKLEQKMKGEQAEALKQANNLHKEEVESFKNRIKGLEKDMSNKKIEVEKLVFSLTKWEKEAREKEDQLRKQEGTVGSLNEKITKMHDEIAGYKNKVDNMELTLQKKTTELNSAVKTVNQLTSEKNSLSNDLATYKDFNGELTKKVQSINEACKKAENERKALKSENEKIVLEMEKKQVEIQRLHDQVEQINKERKDQIEELNKIAENQQSEKGRVSNLQGDLNQKSIEINTLKTRLEILTLDLDNKVKENSNLVSKGEYLEKEKEKMEEELQKVVKELEKQKSVGRELEQKAEDVKVLYEQVQIELDAKTEKCEELRRTVKELTEKMEKVEKNLSELVKENEGLVKQGQEKDVEKEGRIQGMNERVMQLEEEIRCKVMELKEKEDDYKVLREREQAEGIAEQKDRDQEKEDLVKKLEEEMEGSKKIIEELEKQGQSYQEEVRNKQSEIDGLRKQVSVSGVETEKARNENSALTTQIFEGKSKIEALISELGLFEREAASKLDYLK